jgi:hypothetical protein
MAGLGALGAGAGLALLCLLLLFFTRPAQYTGMDATLRTLTWIAFIGVFAALILVHVILGRQLLALSRGERPAP